jgi:hypothetical protein
MAVCFDRTKAIGATSRGVGGDDTVTGGNGIRGRFADIAGGNRTRDLQSTGGGGGPDADVPDATLSKHPK